MKADRISSIFWLIFSGAVCTESYRLGLGTIHRPGPGFLFFWAGIILALMSLIVCVQAWIKKNPSETGQRILPGKRLWKILQVLIALFLYVLLMEKLGFVIVTLLLFLFLLGWVEKRGWLQTALVSLAVTAAAYLIFETALQSQLPKGLLGSFHF